MPPSGSIRLIKPRRGLDVRCDVDHEADADLLQELEVVGAEEATLMDASIPAVTGEALEDQVCCAVALAEVAPMAHSVVVLVGPARLRKFPGRHASRSSGRASHHRYEKEARKPAVAAGQATTDMRRKLENKWLCKCNLTYACTRRNELNDP